MHRVDRGPEPEGLQRIRATYTPRWVEHYRNGVGSTPRDSHWLGFHSELSQRFSGLCAYCEETSKGEIDHFRPKSRFPELVYAWTNWLLACHDCNQAKGDKWPDGGYVDPCAGYPADWPENYFEFRAKTGMMVPKRASRPDNRDKAQRMISDLNLNESHHLRKRLEWLSLVSAALALNPDSETSDMASLRRKLASRSSQLSSVTRAWLAERGYPAED